MKKIIFILLVFIFMFLLVVPLNASSFYSVKDIISVVGSGSNSLLFQDGVDSISGTVNWEKEGDYEVFAGINDEVYKINVYVKSNNQLINGFEIFEDLGTLDLKFNNCDEIISYDTYLVDEQTYFIYYNCLYNGKTFAHLYKYNNGECLAYYYFNYNASIESLSYNGSFLFVLMNVYNDNINIQICKFDSDLKLQSSYMYESNSDDFSKKIYFKNGLLYVFCEVKSNEGLVERENTNCVIAILRINPYNYFIESYKLIYNNYDNYLCDVKLENDSFLVLTKLNGSSGSLYHTINRSYSGYYLLNLDYDLNYKCLKCFEDEIEFYDIFDFSLNNYFVSWKENDTKIIIKSASYLKENIFELESFGKKITSLCSLYFNDCFYLFVNLENKLSKIILIYEDKYIVKNIQDKDFECLMAGKNEYSMYLYCESYEKRLFSFGVIQGNMVNNLYNNIEYQSININKNAKKIEGKEIIDLNEVSYGEYKTVSKFESEDYIITYYSKYKVPLVINVRPNESYDPGLNVCLNADAVLNGLKMDRSFKLDEIGKYQLEIFDVNGENLLYSFEIIDPNINLLENFSSYSNEDIVEYFGYDFNENEKLDYFVNVNHNLDKDIKFNDKIYIIFFSSVSIYFLILILLKNKLKKSGERNEKFNS